MQKPPLAVRRMVRGGGIFEENDGGDSPQISVKPVQFAWADRGVRPYRGYALETRTQISISSFSLRASSSSIFLLLSSVSF